MIRSPTWRRNQDKLDHIQWFVVALWIFATICYLPAALSQPLPSQPFLVSSSAPYRLQNQAEPSMHSLSAAQVGRLASERCGPANLISSDAKSISPQSASICKNEECQQQIRSVFQAAVGCRLRQTASANAMKLHYGIAACLKAERIFDQTRDLLIQQERTQTQLVDKGIPIPDPTSIGRLKTSLQDKRMENQSKLAVFRSQLSTLIGSENACDHAPVEFDDIVPSDRNACEHFDQALNCRCDRMALTRLRSSINADTLDAWASIASQVTGVPFVTKKKPFWSKVLRPQQSRTEIECAIAARRNWLDDLIAERTKQIAMEVDVAFERKRTAALRWVNASEQIANWGNRITQLESLSEVQGNLAVQFESQLNRSQTEGQRIERWSDWHLANVDLLLAMGCDL